MQSPFSEKRLANGLRIVCEVMPQVKSAAVGFLVRTGSRHEAPSEHGVSHFLEHMCFKGTPKRSWFDINVRFDQLGSMYNAFTSKEHTFYYGWVPHERTDDQLELLSDMLRPALPPDDFETERNVILEEIAMSDDSFERHVSNFLHAVVFGKHPLGHEILGEKESIQTIPRATMVDYLARRYAADNTVLIAAGAIEPNAVFDSVERYCESWHPAPNGKTKAEPPQLALAGKHLLRLEKYQQQTIAELFPSVPHGHADEETIDAFVSLFGGANSRCYWNIIQKGICTSAGAVWLSYSDCGMLALFADGEPPRCEEMLAAVRAQAAIAVRDGFTEEEVQRVKNRRRTQLALEAESPRTRLMQLLDDIEVYDGPRSAESRLAAVEAVSRESIADYLRRFPITGEGMLISVGPRQWPGS